MSWEDRDYANEGRSGMGKPGGDWGGLKPSFDNPLTWAITIGRVSGISVRVHAILVIFIVIMLLRAAVPPERAQTQASIDLMLTAIAMGSLFVIVLAHEFGHCLACRWMGGEADEILLWPLGGLAYCRPRNSWKAHLVTAIGGPFVNVIVCVVGGGMLYALTGVFWGVAVPNPLTLAGIYEPEVSRSLAHQSLFLINTTSLILLLFNLMPVFPLDGGRILQASLWPHLGYGSSMRFAVRSGFVGAVLLGIFGAVTSQWEIVGIALFGGVTCYITQKQLQWTNETMGFESDEYALSLHSGRAEEKADAPKQSHPTRQERKAQRQAQQEQQESQEVDRILLKIAHSGMESLTRGEKLLLERVTQRKRQGQ